MKQRLLFPPFPEYLVLESVRNYTTHIYCDLCMDCITEPMKNCYGVQGSFYIDTRYRLSVCKQCLKEKYKL